MATPGHSGKPLIQKLGFKTGFRVHAVNTPPHYLSLLGPDVKSVQWESDPAKADAIHLFASNLDQLESSLPPLVNALQKGCMLWVSWPKKSSSLYVDLTEDMIRFIALPFGVVDIKVCAVDADWSGLKLVWRKLEH